MVNCIKIYEVKVPYDGGRLQKALLFEMFQKIIFLIETLLEHYFPT